MQSVNQTTNFSSDLQLYDMEAEKSVLGAMIKNNEIVSDIIDANLTKNDFYYPPHKLIYEIMLNLFDQRKPVDPIILKDELEKQGKLEEVGGFAYLVFLPDSVVSAVNAKYYAEIIIDKAKRRNLYYVGEEIMKLQHNQELDSDTLLDEAEGLILKTARDKATTKAKSIYDLLHEVFQYTNFGEMTTGHKIAGLTTGFGDLDEVINGLQQSQFYVIAARPRIGKTTLAINIMRHVILEEKKPVLFFSLEMNARLLAAIMLCSHCDVNYHNASKGIITQEDKKKLFIAAGAFEKAPLYIDDSSDLTILELRSRARRMKMQMKDLSLVVIDYLQLLQAKDRRVESRQQEIAMISMKLKALAKELKIPVLAVAQLNRDPEKLKERPRMSHLRESGAIEQDADVVMLLDRKEVQDLESPENEGICDVYIDKNRTGPIMKKRLTFIKEFFSFRPYSGKEEE